MKVYSIGSKGLQAKNCKVKFIKYCFKNFEVSDTFGKKLFIYYKVKK